MKGDDTHYIVLKKYQLYCGSTKQILNKKRYLRTLKIAIIFSSLA